MRFFGSPKPNPKVASAAGEDGRTAAAVALSLALDGIGGQLTPPEVAAVAVALELHRSASAAASAVAPVSDAWAYSGRWQQMSSRLARQSRGA